MLKLRKYKYTPILGWSISRYDTFSVCKRQYYYQYYSKHDPVYPAERIKALKNLTSIPLKIGSIAHDTIANILNSLLKSTLQIDRTQVIADVKRKAEKVCQTQKSFFEVHYAQKEKVVPADIMPLIEEYLKIFIESKRFDQIKYQAMHNKNGWFIDFPGNYGETRIDGLKAYCKVDFLYTDGKRRIILDWKTGKQNTSKDTKQLKAYSLWAKNEFGDDACNIEAISAYLRSAYEELLIQPSEDQLSKLVEQIREETEEMYKFCSNVSENIPVDKDSFEMIQNNRFCRYCNFKELCSRV